MPCPDFPIPALPRPVLVILGPTAVGKTELSIRLAEQLGGEIVSADSRYFYRGMDIGTAKPLASELARVPHHLIDVAAPPQHWSLAVFQQAARAVIAQIHQRGRLPIVVGGTGQYVRAVIEEWRLPDTPPNPDLRDVLERWAGEIGASGLHQRLARLDPAAAENILPGNLRRSIRALEVIFSTGRLFSVQRQKMPSPYQRLLVGLKRPRPELFQRIDQRIDRMLADGFLDEVRGLLARGYAPDLPPFSAIGYREMIQHLQGEIGLDEALLLIRRHTRQFVRRQANWFKETDPEIHWFDAEPDPLESIVEMICSSDWLVDAEQGLPGVVPGLS